MKFSREEFRINFASLRFAYLHSTARALFLFFCGLLEMDGLFDKQQKIITTRLVPARQEEEKKEIGTIEVDMVVWAPAWALQYYSFLSKIRGRHRSEKRGAKQKRNTNTNNNNNNKCAERKGTLDEETTKRTW